MHVAAKQNPSAVIRVEVRSCDLSQCHRANSMSEVYVVTEIDKKVNLYSEQKKATENEKV